jgi:hypothetical protein
MKIRPVGGELFHADGRTGGLRLDGTKSRFSQLCERAQSFRKLIYKNTTDFSEIDRHIYNSEIMNSKVNESTNPEYVIKGLVKLAVEINSQEYEMCFSNRVSDGQFVNTDYTRILSQTIKRKSDFVRRVTATRSVHM